MKYSIGVSATDEVVTDDRGIKTRIMPKDLALMILENYKTGTPMLLGHDYNHLFGWTRPLGIHIEPKIVRSLTIGKEIERPQEYKNVKEQLIKFYKKRLEENADKLEKLKELINEHLLGNEIPFIQECLYIYEKDLALRVFPQLSEKFDKNCLISIKELNAIDLGVYQIGELCIFANRLFRRSFHILNSLNIPFFYQLNKLKDKISNLQIRIDPDIVGLASSFGMHFEREYWWGPLFNDDLTSIKPGETKYRVGEMKNFTSLIRTDFNWKIRKFEHIFEAEEIYNNPSPIHPPINDIDYFGCRYVHSIIKRDSQKIHFDGAIKAYSKKQLSERIQKNLSKSGRKTNYIKLWRLDGNISIPIWKRLLSDYFRDNYLVGEYLGGKDEMLDIYKRNNSYINNKKNALKTIKEPKIQILISFHHWVYELTQERKIVYIPSLSQILNEDFLNLLNDKKISYQVSKKMELTNDFKKILKLPLLIHNKMDTPTLVKQTYEIIKEFIKILKDFKKTELFGYNIGYSIGADEIRISVLGELSEMDKWLNHPISQPKYSRNEFLEWIDKISEYATKTYPERDEISDILPKLNIQGIL